MVFEGVRHSAKVRFASFAAPPRAVHERPLRFHLSRVVLERPLRFHLSCVVHEWVLRVASPCPLLKEGVENGLPPSLAEQVV